MQVRVESKSKLTQYHSLKQYETSKEPTKKIQKPAHQKSNQKNKMTKTNPHSQSKSKIHNKSNKINQNFNSLNVPPDKNKNHHEMQPLKKQPRKQQKLSRNSSEKLIKSKSTIRLQPKTERSRLSPSPIIHKDPHLQQQRSKISRNQTSRSQREKKPIGKTKQEKPMMKRTGSMVTINTKRQITDRNPINRVSIKTEGSSKMNSVIRQDQKHKKTKKKEVTNKRDVPVQKETIILKKGPKSKLQTKIQRSILYSQVSFQEYCQENPYESALIHTQNGAPYSYPKIKTQGCQASSMEHAFEQKYTIQKHIAAIKIQKTFRGYITRKYIFEAIYLSTKARIIQTWWRKMMQKKKHKPHKPHLSIQSSLITIKDFNDTIKTDRQKLFSQSKENTLSNQKINFRDLFKNILEEDQESQNSIVGQKSKHGQLREKCLSPQQKFLNKQVYVEQKINAEIHSEKVFNSPKPLNSPGPGLKTPTSITCNIKQFFNSSNQKQKIKELIQSPRMRSPPPPKTTPISNNHQPPTQQFQIYKPTIETYQAFQTNFQAIQETSLLLVDYFRDRQKQMQAFLVRVQAMAYFRTQIVLNNWNSFKLLTESRFQEDNTLPLDYEFLQYNERPSIFPQELREDILKFPQIQIDLNNKNYNLQDKLSGSIHRAYIEFIFDVLEQAFYQSYKNCVIEWNKSLRVRHFDTKQNLFELAFSDALGFITEWAEVLCGIIVDHPEDYEVQIKERILKLDRQIEYWDLGQGSRLGIKMQISQKVLDQLIEELELQFIRKGL